MATDLRSVNASEERQTAGRLRIDGLLALPSNFTAHTATGAMTLTRQSAQFLRIDPDGAARALTLPTDGENGDFFVIVNIGTAAEDITVNTSLVTITPGDFAIVYHNGTAWALFLLNAGGVT